MTGEPLEFKAPVSVLRALRNTAILCGLLFVVGLFVEPRRVWGGYLMGFILFVGLALAGGVFVSILYVTGSRWGTALRRIPEAMLGTLPRGALLGVILLFGVPSLYSWAQPGAVHGSLLLQDKSAFLNIPFFCIRTLAYFALWIWCGRKLLGESRGQDLDGDRIHTARNLRHGILFMAVFAVTFSLASVDWVQSLEPEWFSTIFALITASGLATGGLAVVMIVTVLLRRHGCFHGKVTRSHLDDLGKVAMGLSLFWVYIWFCQYLLIWYTDVPEETGYFVARAALGWSALSAANLILCFVVPFLVLMPKTLRRKGAVLLRVGIVMLVGHMLDTYLLVEPSILGAHPGLGLFELAPVVGALALFGHGLLARLQEASLMPTGDPWLPESLRYRC